MVSDPVQQGELIVFVQVGLQERHGECRAERTETRTLDMANTMLIILCGKNVCEEIKEKYHLAFTKSWMVIKSKSTLFITKRPGSKYNNIKNVCSKV